MDQHLLQEQPGLGAGNGSPEKAWTCPLTKAAEISSPSPRKGAIGRQLKKLGDALIADHAPSSRGF